MNSSSRFFRIPASLLVLPALMAATAFAQPPRTLTVESMPYERLAIAASPADLNGESDGVTHFSRQYADGSVVNLEAPAADGSNTFVKWQLDGVDFSAGPAASVTMDADHVMTAVYSANIPPPVTEVLVNGSFEDGFTGWTATGNLYLGNNATTATDGSAWVAFNGGQTDPNGVVSQTFATQPGLSYTLSFDVGVYSFKQYDQSLQFQVMGATERLSGIETLTGGLNGSLEWFPKSYGFIADSATTTLIFTDVSPTSDSLDLYLDHVQVSGAINIPPAAVEDSIEIHAGQKAVIPVLVNDLGIMDQRTVEVVTPPSVGMATVQPSGEILYEHEGEDTSPASFTYRVSGEGGTSDPATVTVSLASSLRIAGNGINVPTEPPVTAVQVVPAFPGVVFDEPLAIASPPGDTSRLFVCERGGKIKTIPDVTAAEATSSLFLDLAQAVENPIRVPLESWDPGRYDESGLMGMAFHPNFAENGHFYVSYLVKKSNDTTYTDAKGRIFPVLYQRLSRFTVPPEQIGQPAPVADPLSELVLIEQRDRDDGHNCSDLHFGADGYLYWAIGDETNPNDYFGNSQRIDMNFFGALLRIDVDKRPGNLEPNEHPNPAAASLGYSATPGIPRDEFPEGSGNFRARYSIPIDNPYVHTSLGGTWDGTFNGSAISSGSLPYVRSEFWAVGLRSPWRFHIDLPTGEIWLGDVGQDKYEELNLITNGGNYGWAFRDGLHSGPKTPPAGFTPIDPVYEYLHTTEPGAAEYKGNSIIGGVVYRGERFASLTGAYIFGDFVSGNIWMLTRPEGVVTVERIAGQPGLTTFGTDPSNGDVLVTDYYNGRIMRIVTATPDTTFPTTLSATGLFADLTDLSPAPGVLPYEPNLRFWSDYAVKRRWFAIPDPAAKMTWSRDTPWTFPSGQIWIKHFDLETERGNPASPAKRIETRLLVKNDSGAYGVSYRWNESGTEATLAPDAGESFPVDITVNGEPYQQQWAIPSRSQCLTCHTPQAGYALSFNTRQLNLTNTINGFTGNQLDLLHDEGYLHNTPASPNLLPRYLRPDETQYPLEARVRSYLAVNCAYCHAGDAGTAPAVWDGRHELTLEQTGLINGNSSLAGGDFKLIVPGDTVHSVVLQRMGGTGGFTRMPPLGTNEIDPENIALVTEWINQKLPGRQMYADWREQVFGSATSPEGEPTADADGDGFSNQDEFLTGTNATSGASFLCPTMTHDGGEVSLGFTIPENRSVQVETSDNLADWLLWDVPANNGVAQPGGQTLFSGPAQGPLRFYRLLIRER